MSGLVWQSENAPFDEDGFSQHQRDLETLFLAINELKASVGVSLAGEPQKNGEAPPPVLPAGTALAGGGSLGGSSGPVTLLGDVTGPPAATSVQRLHGIPLGGTLSADEQALLYNLPSNRWEPVTLIAGNGGLLTKDATGLIEIAGGTARSVVGNSTATAGALAPIVATADGQVFQRLAGTLKFAALSGLLPLVAASDEGKMLWVTPAGAWQAARDVYLGDNPLTASAVQGSFGVVTSTDGDYIKTSSAGIELYDRSISTATPLIKIALGHASLNAPARQIAVGEASVCDPATGTVKTMLLLRSDVY